MQHKPKRPMNQIINVKMKERGQESLTTNTIHFIILLSFKEHPDLRILESVNKKATELKLMEIKTFLAAKAKLKVLRATPGTIYAINEKDKKDAF